MRKQIIYLTIPLVIIVSAFILGLKFKPVPTATNQNQPTDQTVITNSTNEENTGEIEKTEEIIKPQSEIPTEVKNSDVAVYQSIYGYTLNYPKIYDKPDNNYSVWVVKKGEAMADLLEEWGVNKEQETIFVIDVYPIDKQEEVFNYYQHKRLDQKVVWNTIVANRIKGMGTYDDLMIVKDDNFYLIHSSFNKNFSLPEYAEYYNILITLKFIPKIDF